PIALRLAGPALGGLIVASFGASTAFVLDAVTFAASTGAIVAVRAPLQIHSPAASTRAAIGEGFRFVRRHVWLWGTLASAAIAYPALLGPTERLIPLVVKNVLHASAAALGIVYAAGGIGAVAAAAAMAQHGHPPRDIRLQHTSWARA